MTKPNDRSFWFPGRQKRPGNDAAELSLVRMGRFVILASFIVASADMWLLGFPLLSLITLAIYPTYVVLWWPAVRTRRVEAVALVVIAAAVGALYIAGALRLW